MKRLLAVLMVALGSSACGWHQGLLVPDPTARSIGVEVFDNLSLEPGVEADLASHVSEALVDLSDLPLVAPGEADLVVRGTVLELRRRSGIRSSENELLEAGARIEVEAALVRRKDSAILATSRTGLWADWATGTPGLGGPGLGEGPARERLLRNLADRLILDLFGDRSDE